MDTDRWRFGQRVGVGAPGDPARASRERAGPIDHFVCEWSLPPLPGEVHSPFPAVDMLERGTEIVIWVDLPGLDPAEVEVTAQPGVLTVRGERKPASEAKREEYTCCERWAGRFERNLFLPSGADAQTLQVTFRNGLLEARLARVDRATESAHLGSERSTSPRGIPTPSGERSVSQG